MVGFLLALNAVLITTPERRRFTAEMRTLGFTRRYILTILAFQATILGVVGSADRGGRSATCCSKRSFTAPRLPVLGFLVGSQQPFRVRLVLLALACGVLAALAASIPCVLDLRSEVARRGASRAGRSRTAADPGADRPARLIGVALTAAISLARARRHGSDDRGRSAAGGSDSVLRAGGAQRRPVADRKARR